MKKFIITLSLLLMTAIGFSQEPGIDSMQITKAYPEKPDVVATVFTYDELFKTMSIKSDSLKLDEFIVIFYYKSYPDGPQKKMSKAYKRNR